MGLDVSILVRGSENDLLYLRNNWDFHDMFCDFSVGKVHEEYDDFYVDLSTLEGVTLRLLEAMLKEGIDPSITPDVVPQEFWDEDVTNYSWVELLPIYLRIMINLRAEMEKYSPLVYAWSA